MKYLCFDVGGTFIKYAVFDNQAAFLSKGKYPTNVTSPQQFFADMAKIADEQTELSAIGLSFPGFINTETGFVLRAGALYQLDGLNLVEQLQEQLITKVPIVIENDANCAALAEKLNGAAQDVTDFAVITLGTGVGGGIVINGQVLHGRNYRAGEFGMMLTDVTARGEATLHDLAATSSLVRRFAEAKNLPIEQVSGELIMSQQDDPITQQVLGDWAHYVAIAIFNLVVTNDPQRILIGGGISQDQRILPYITKALNDIRFWADFQVEIGLCQHDNDSGLLGALYLAKQQVEGVA